MYSDYIKGLYRPSLEKSDRASFICLDKNEAPFSSLDSIEELITSDDIKNLNSYPNPYSLYEQLADYLNVNINNILITQGSEQALEFTFRVFLDVGDEVVFLEPSFAMFNVFAYQNKANVRTIKFEEDISLNIKKVLDTITSKTKLFALANPNNPTGTAFSENDLYQIAIHTQNTNTIFLLDEAYFHYFMVNSISFIEEFDHIIITRTFSKAFGIAGARIGYAISKAKNIELLRKVKPIDELNSLSIILAQKVLFNAQENLDKNILQVKKWKELFSVQSWKNLNYIPTEGNFILLKSSNYSKHQKMFLQSKILPKMDFPEKYLSNCFRFSVSNDSVMSKILDLLKEE